MPKLTDDKEGPGKDLDLSKTYRYLPILMLISKEDHRPHFFTSSEDQCSAHSECSGEKNMERIQEI